MEKHLAFSLIVIIIEGEVSCVVELDKPVDTSNSEVLLGPAEF